MICSSTLHIQKWPFKGCNKEQQCCLDRLQVWLSPVWPPSFLCRLRAPLPSGITMVVQMPHPSTHDTVGLVSLAPTAPRHVRHRAPAPQWSSSPQGSSLSQGCEGGTIFRALLVLERCLSAPGHFLSTSHSHGSGIPSHFMGNFTITRMPYCTSSRSLIPSQRASISMCAPWGRTGMLRP